MLTDCSFNAIQSKQDIGKYITEIEMFELLNYEVILKENIWKLKELLDDDALGNKITDIISSIESQISLIMWSISIGGDEKEKIRGYQALFIHKFLSNLKWLYKNDVNDTLQVQFSNTWVDESEWKVGTKKVVTKSRIVQKSKRVSKNSNKRKFSDRLSIITVKSNYLSEFYDKNKNLFSNLNNSQKKKDLCTKLKKYILRICSSVVIDENLPLEFFEDFDTQLLEFVNTLNDKIDTECRWCFITSFNSDLLEKFKNACLNLYNSNEKRRNIAKK